MRLSAPASSGGRFSANATRPSAPSSDRHQVVEQLLRVARATSASSVAAASTTRRLARTASGAAATICSRDGDRLVERGARRDQPADEPEVVRARGVDGFAGEDRVHRRGAPDRAREPEQSAGGRDQVVPHLGEPERRPGGRDDDVGGEHDLEPARGRQSVDRDHDRLLRARGTRTRRSRRARCRACRRSGLPDHLQVGARAEHRARLLAGVRARARRPRRRGRPRGGRPRLRARGARSRSTALRASGRLRVMTPIRSTVAYRTAGTAQM